MANSYQLEVVTPERIMLSERVVETIAPGSEGELGVLANHAPLMTALKPGEVSVTLADGRTTSHIVIAGGFLEVASSAEGGRTTILADSAERSDEIDITRAEADLEAARQMLAEASVGSAQQEQAQQAFAHAETRIRVGRNRR
jgi:F-type H+-transporting ATPase subunit epsilon